MNNIELEEKITKEFELITKKLGISNTKLMFEKIEERALATCQAEPDLTNTIKIDIDKNIKSSCTEVLIHEISHALTNNISLLFYTNHCIEFALVMNSIRFGIYGKKNDFIRIYDIKDEINYHKMNVRLFHRLAQRLSRYLKNQELFQKKVIEYAYIIRQYPLNNNVIINKNIKKELRKEKMKNKYLKIALACFAVIDLAFMVIHYV